MAYAMATIYKGKYTGIDTFQDAILTNYKSGITLNHIEFDRLDNRDHWLVSGRLTWSNGDVWVYFGQDGNADRACEHIRRAIHDSVNPRFNSQDYDTSEAIYTAIPVTRFNARTQKEIKGYLETYMSERYDQLLYLV